MPAMKKGSNNDDKNDDKKVVIRNLLWRSMTKVKGRLTSAVVAYLGASCIGLSVHEWRATCVCGRGVTMEVEDEVEAIVVRRGRRKWRTRSRRKRRRGGVGGGVSELGTYTPEWSSWWKDNWGTEVRVPRDDGSGRGEGETRWRRWGNKGGAQEENGVRKESNLFSLSVLRNILHSGSRVCLDRDEKWTVVSIKSCVWRAWLGGGTKEHTLYLYVSVQQGNETGCWCWW